MNQVFRYRLYGLAIDSEIDLGAATEESVTPPDVVIRHGRVPPAGKNSLEEEFVRFSRLGSFHFIKGREIVASLLPAFSRDLLRVFLLGRGMAYLHRQRGSFPLHGSAIAVDGQAILLIGQVGMGKSTTAAAFHSQGYRVLSDDVCPVRVIDGACVLRPGRSRVRLCDDAAEFFGALDPSAEFVVDKHDFQLSGQDPGGEWPVARIYFLGDGTDFRVEATTAMEAAVILGRECFVRLRLASPEVLAEHLRNTVAVAGLGICRRLLRPRDLSRITDLVHLVEHDMMTGSADPFVPSHLPEAAQTELAQGHTRGEGERPARISPAIG